MMGNSNKSSLRKAQSVPDTQRLPPDAPVFIKVSKSQSQQRLNQSVGKASGSKLGKLHKDKGHSKAPVEGVPQLAPAEAAFLPDFPLRGDLEELDFEVIDVIAKGAYGNVIKVQREDSKRFYAMKVLDKRQIIEEGAIRQCKDEAAIQSMAGDHPLVVKAYEYWQSQLNLYIVLDYIPHGDMFTLWTFHGAFPEALVQLYIAEMAMVIDYLHNSSVIYRDVKMENILFDQKGHIQLTDFGLAKWLQGGEQTRTVCGTLQYMAPEVLSVYPYSHSADWWSLGILMYAMLAGRYPVDGADTHTRMAQKVFDCDYLLPSNVSDAAQDVINRILTKSPHKRLGDMYTLQDLDFFQDVFFPDLLDKKISPIDVVPPDFFPMTGESWAPHLLTEEEMRNFDQFDGVNNNYKDSTQESAHHRSYQRHHHRTNNDRGSSHHTYKHKNDRLLRQQSTPEQLNYNHNDSYEDEQARDWPYDGRGSRDDYRYRAASASSNNEHSRDPGHFNHTNDSQPAHQYHQGLENTRHHHSSEADNLSYRSSNYDGSMQRSRNPMAYPESKRSGEWEREPERSSRPSDQHGLATISSPYTRNGSSREPEATSPSAISPSSVYKTMEAAPTVTLKAPSSYSGQSGHFDSGYGSDHPRSKPNLSDHRVSNQTFGYLGPGPPYNVEPTRSYNDNTNRANTQQPMLTRPLNSHPYPSNTKPAAEYKSVEAPPTITLPTGPTLSPPPVSTRNTPSDHAPPENHMNFAHYSGPVLTAPKHYNAPPPVAAKPVPPPKPQAPVRPQPAPRRSLQRRNNPQVPSNTTATLTSSSGLTPNAPDPTQRTMDESSSSIQHSAGSSMVSPYSSSLQNTYPTNAQPLPRAVPSSSGFNSSLDQNSFKPTNPHGIETANPQDGSIGRPLVHYDQSNNENRYSDGSQGSVRSPTSQSNFKWKLPANVAPSFV